MREIYALAHLHLSTASH